MIEVKNLEKNFKGHYVLAGVSFKVKKGEFLGIVGPNGSGKSTLLRTLVGLIF